VQCNKLKFIESKVSRKDLINESYKSFSTKVIKEIELSNKGVDEYYRPAIELLNYIYDYYNADKV
jgi:hypothetical protein